MLCLKQALSARAGDVEKRLLDAATRLFLQHGFERTSSDQVAALARTGNASLYARFLDKALFTAVVRSTVERALGPRRRDRYEAFTP